MGFSEGFDAAGNGCDGIGGIGMHRPAAPLWPQAYAAPGSSCARKKAKR
jgi:hypothetical protein